MNNKITNDINNQTAKNFSRVIDKYYSLVKKIAYHLINRLPSVVQLDDLTQSGIIGLIEAYKNYNDTKGASFETYAGIRIRGSMLDEIRRGDWAPRSVHRNTRKITRAIQVIENKYGRDARDEEIAKELDVSLHDYYKMLKDSNSAKLFGFEEMGISADSISQSLGTNIPGPLENLDASKFKELMAEHIGYLPERERLVLILYYDEELNLRQIGEILRVSESRISQIHNQATMRLRARLEKIF